MKGLTLLVLAATLSADTYTVRKFTTPGDETVVAEYRKGHNIRNETKSSTRPPTIRIDRVDDGVTYLIDPRSRKYAEAEKPDFLSQLARWIMRQPETRVSGKTVDVYYETIDTGERQQILGKMAKHFVLRQRYVAEPGACGGSQQTESDAWSVDVSTVPPVQSTGSFIYSSLSSCRDKVVIHGQPLPPGTLVRQSIGSFTTEILEMSSSTLDPSLFELPRGYEKVDQLPGQESLTPSERQAMEWRQLHMAVASWFR